jgi:DNA processing protein
MLTEVSPVELLGFLALTWPAEKAQIVYERIHSVGDAERVLAGKEGSALDPVSAAEIKSANAEILRLRSLGIKILARGHSEFPHALLQLHKPPSILFFRGDDLRATETKIPVAIVGSRKADKLSCEIARSMARAIAGASGCVVSGLAFGIDAEAHCGALESGEIATTVAVLGNGLEFGIYPAAHQRLAERILKNGGLLFSQFHPLMKPFPYNFLERNQIIAALARSVIIVQAAERSGALATARHAIDLGRDLLVVPGAAGDERFIGSNRLIKQGAYLISEIADVFGLIPELVPNATSAAKTAPVELSELQASIHRALTAEPVHYDELLRAFPDSGALAQALAGLEEFELVRWLPGNFLAKRCAI